MTWGYALGWPSTYLALDPDPLLAKLKLVHQHGLQTVGVSLGEWAGLDEEKRNSTARFLEDHDLRLTLGIHLPWKKGAEEVEAAAAQSLGLLKELGGLARAPIATTAGSGLHRFSKEVPLAQQLDDMEKGFASLAQGCQELGIPLAIENHGDYYISDLVELCQRVPGLGIFLDTGNCYLIGEKPLEAAKEAAPYVLGSHFKDQVVAPRPSGSPLCFEVGNAIPGRGDVPLKEIFQVIWKGCPDRERLAMQIEMFPSPWEGPEALAQLAEAAAFVKSLEAAE